MLATADGPAGGCPPPHAMVNRHTPAAAKPETGNQKREALFNNVDSDVVFSPKISGMLNESSLLIFGKVKKKEKFGMVGFK